MRGTRRSRQGEAKVGEASGNRAFVEGEGGCLCGRLRYRVSAPLLATLVIAVLGCALQPPPKPRVHHVPRTDPAPPYPEARYREPSPYVPYVGWGRHSISTRLSQIGPRARDRWWPYFRRAGVSYPPASVVLVALKRERMIEVYAGPSPYRLSMLRGIGVTAASGGPGPKLREGDRQVPEGIYRIDQLNPNSNFHVSLRLAYPNALDLRMAERDGRHRLGGNIMIHGSDQSIGCLAVGDLAAEDLFVIAADAGPDNVSVVIAPRDFRRTREIEPMPGQPDWVRELYADLDLKLRSLPPPFARPATYARQGALDDPSRQARSAAPPRQPKQPAWLTEPRPQQNAGAARYETRNDAPPWGADPSAR